MKDDRKRIQPETFLVPAGVKYKYGGSDMEQHRKDPLDESEAEVRK